MCPCGFAITRRAPLIKVHGDEDALRVANRGDDAWRMVLPDRFDWRLFVIALGLMAAPIFHSGRQLWQRRPVALAAGLTT